MCSTTELSALLESGKLTLPEKVSSVSYGGFAAAFTFSHRILLPPSFIVTRAIEVIVETTAFWALQGTLDYQLGHLRNVAVKKIGGHLQIPVVLTNFLEQIFNTRLGAQQAFAKGTNDRSRNPTYTCGFHPSYGSPPRVHQGLPPRRKCQPGKRQICRRLRLSQDRLGRTMGTD